MKKTNRVLSQENRSAVNQIKKERINITFFKITEVLRFGLPKLLIFDRFYKVFDMAGCHVIHSEKPNAFLIIFDVILRFGLEIIKVRQAL